MSKHEIIEKIIEMLQYMKTQSGTYELECRVGKFMTDNSFIAGYDTDHMNIIKRLRARLAYMVRTRPDVWSEHSQNIKYTKMMYGDIRRIITDSEDIVQKKLRVSTIDLFTSNRPYHLRMRLSKEISVESTNELEVPPDLIQYVQRYSVRENVNGLIFQWDISKVTKPVKIKKDLFNEPCQYHCEVEFISALENISFEKIAEEFYKRSLALVGTYCSGEFNIINLSILKNDDR